MPGKLVYLAPDLPRVTSSWWQGFAEATMRRFEYFAEKRRPLEDVWIECDMGYLSRRKLPYMESMPYIDDSDFGDPIIFDGVNALSYRLAQNMMPKDDSWLTVLGKNGEDPALIKQVQAQQTWMHRLAKTRRKFCRHLKQLIIRGTSHIFLRWEIRERLKRLGTAKGRRLLKKHLELEGADPELINQINMVRQSEIVYNGPNPLIADAFDVFMDPDADMLYDTQPSFFLRLFMRPSTLKNTEDENGEKVYQNLENIVESNAEDLRRGAASNTHDDMERRERSAKVMHLNDTEMPSLSAKVIPVYVYYAAYEEYDGKEFYDTYFYIAMGADGIPRVIRVEENPSYGGHCHLLTDTYIDWFTNVAYGIGGVEKILSAYHQKNFFDAIQLNAAAAAGFPAYLVAGGYLVQDMLKVQPGAINEIAQMAIGQEFIKTMPVPENGAKISGAESQMLSQRIGRSFDTAGATGSGVESASPDRETATAVNYKATNQNLSVDEQGEKFGDTLQLYCQWTYDENQATAQPNAQKEIEYGQIVGTDVQTNAIKIDQWRQPRSIQVLGLKGVLNQKQNVTEKQTALQTTLQSAQFVPNAQIIVQSMLKSLCLDLNVSTPPEAWMDPMQLAAAMNPQIVAQLLSNPETAMQVMEMLPPDIRQALGQAMQQMNAQEMQAPQQTQGGNGDGGRSANQSAAQGGAAGGNPQGAPGANFA